MTTVRVDQTQGVHVKDHVLSNVKHERSNRDAELLRGFDVDRAGVGIRVCVVNDCALTLLQRLG
jgi:hypothetical protein